MSRPSPLISPSEAALAHRIEQRIVPGLERMHAVLAALDHPERAFSSLLVLGTNGKGSTAALLARMLRAHGVRTGLYTSPHLVRVEERIRLDGEAIPPERLVELVGVLNRFPQLSYFETLTAAALLHFAASGVEVAVLEAGLGGRWDATNAVEPVVTLLTNVGTDHQGWLGEKRTEIAAEKAAALRGREAIVGVWDPEVEPAIRATADPATPLTLASDWASVEVVRGSWFVDRPPTRPGPVRGAASLPSNHDPRSTNDVFFEVAGMTGSATLPLLGGHQEANLTLALAGAAALAKHGIVPALAGDALARGVAAVHWPGRLQWLEMDGRRLLLDGAHNREAMRTLAAALAELGLAGKVHLLFSCLADKPLADLAAILRPRVKSVTVAALDSPRATPLGELAAAFPGAAMCRNVATALTHVRGATPWLVTGSLRLVGEVLQLTGQPVEA